jgi:hypothetical protein
LTTANHKCELQRMRRAASSEVIYDIHFPRGGCFAPVPKIRIPQHPRPHRIEFTG